MTAPQLLDLLVSELPDLANEVRGDEGHTNMLMASFARYTRSAISNHDVAGVKKCFGVADRLLGDPDEELRNVLFASCLGRVYPALGEVSGAWAREHLPPLLRQAWEAYNNCLDKIPQLKGLLG